MKTKTSYCRYRHCKKKLNIEVHGNSEYCPSSENHKQGCAYIERLIRTKEKTKQKLDRKIKQTELKTTLSILFRNSTSKNITVDRFMKLISPFIDHFEKKTINGSELYFFENYSMSKIELSGKSLIKIEKNQNNKI